jgi:hypothetical protein
MPDQDRFAKYRENDRFAKYREQDEPGLLRRVADVGSTVFQAVADPIGFTARQVIPKAPDILRQTGRGLAESGYATAIGTTQLVGADEFAENLREGRESAREFYGAPESGVGAVAGTAARMAGDVAQFMAPGSAIARFAKPATTLGKVGLEVATGAPLDAAIAASGREESLAGMAADITGSETLGQIAESPFGRAAVDVAVGAGIGGSLAAAGARGGRSATRTADDIASTRRVIDEPTGVGRFEKYTEPSTDVVVRAEPAQEPSVVQVATDAVEVGTQPKALDRLQSLHREMRQVEREGEQVSDELFDEFEVAFEERLDRIQNEMDKVKKDVYEQDGPEAHASLLDAFDEWIEHKEGSVQGIGGDQSVWDTDTPEFPTTVDETREALADPNIVIDETGPSDALESRVPALESASTQDPIEGIERQVRAEERPALGTETAQPEAVDDVQGRSGFDEYLADMTERGDAVGMAGGGEAGYVNPTAVGKGIKAFIRRNFTSAGDLPKKVFDRMIRRDGGVNSLQREVAYTLRDFRRTAREVYGTANLSSEQLEQIDTALKGESSVVPEEMRSVVAKMRNDIDDMSRRLIDAGAIDSELVPAVTDNLGLYATRSYQVFDDPKWAEKVLSKHPDVARKVWHLLENENPNLPREEIEGLFKALLERGEDSPLALIQQGKLGSKDLSIVTRRKDIDPAIRALWGEYHDPRVNYARSMTKMAHLLENHKFLQDVRSEGLGQFFFETPISREGVDYVQQFAAEGSKTLEPLNGLYTTREIADAFERVVESSPAPDWLRAYFGVNSAVKFSKTIGSLMTHVRNTVGNVGFAVANGHWRVDKMGEAAKTVWGDLWDVGLKDKAKWREIYRELVDLGVVHESARAGELRDAIADAISDSDTLVGGLPQRVAKKTLRGAQNVYRAEDDVWKVYAYHNEYSRYKKQLPDMPEDELKRHVAAIVRDTYPTYSLVPYGVKMARRFPGVGTFVSFPAEVVRTLGNSLALTAKELKDPALRSIGAQRLAGLATAATSVWGATVASRHMNGIDRDTDQGVRRFLPSWSQNSSLFYLNRNEDGRARFVDLSYTDPYSYIRKPLMAFMRGEDWNEAVLQAGAEAAEPFLSEEILAGKVFDIVRNRKKDGGEVFNPEASWNERAQAIGLHILDALEPGTISSMQRIWRGIRGTTTVHGRSYDPVLEAKAVLTGFRIQELDVPQALSWNARKAQGRMGDAQAMLSSVAGRGGSVDDAELENAYRQSETSRQEIFEGLVQDVAAARNLGMNNRDIHDVLRSVGMSNDQATEVMNGSYLPYRPGDQFLERKARAVASTANPEERRGLIRDYRLRRQRVQQMADSARATRRR